MRQVFVRQWRQDDGRITRHEQFSVLLAVPGILSIRGLSETISSVNPSNRRRARIACQLPLPFRSAPQFRRSVARRAFGAEARLACDVRLQGICSHRVFVYSASNWPGARSCL
jgi:hypothetical protein